MVTLNSTGTFTVGDSELDYRFTGPQPLNLPAWAFPPEDEGGSWAVPQGA